MLSQVDLLASLAALAGQTLASGEAPDSRDSTAALLGASKVGRAQLVEQAGALALRQGHWKYIEPNNRPKMDTNTNIELGNDPVAQLYDLASDPGETRNLAARLPDRANAMAALLQQIRERSEPRPLNRRTR